MTQALEAATAPPTVIPTVTPTATARPLTAVAQREPVDLEVTTWPTVAIVGMGYVGLPTALSLHAAGGSVLGIDTSSTRLARIREGSVDLVPTDQVQLREALASARFDMTSDASRIREADAVIICVPTPLDDHLLPDLGPLQGACQAVVAHARAGQLLILTSTTYVGSTADLLARPLAERGLVAGRDVNVAFSPERIDPGNAAHSQGTTPRVVGGMTPACALRAFTLLASFVGAVHTVSSAEAAELTKLLENTFRAVNIALANEFADIARALDLDVIEVIDAAATKPYGFMPFYPGPGVGGHCIPCDPHYLLWQLRSQRREAPLVEQSMRAIAARPDRVLARAREVLSDAGRGLAGARVLVLGVSYKPDVEDVRESSALPLVEGLHDAGADVAFYDPLVTSLERVVRCPVRRAEDPAHEDWDLVIVHTLHSSTPYACLARTSRVLDATYRLPAAPNRHVP